MKSRVDAPIYFPIERGLYEVAPNLKPLGVDLGQGSWDQKVFQVDSLFPKYRKNKIACRKERLSKYETRHDLDAKTENRLALVILHRLVQDHPEIFQLNKSQDLFELHCLHSHDLIQLSGDGSLKDYQPSGDIGPQVTSALDALALQIQEDLSLVQRRGGSDSLSYLHLCSPSHWAAEDKIGKSFVEIHTPIPHIDKIQRAASNMIEAMISKGPFVRFIWSFVTDQRLNHHPVAPQGIDSAEWKGRSFAKEKSSPFDFRVERQVILGMPEVEAALFTIRISFIEGFRLKADTHQREQLISALKSMSPESRIYKGISPCYSDLLSYLEN